MPPLPTIDNEQKENLGNTIQAEERSFIHSRTFPLSPIAGIFSRRVPVKADHLAQLAGKDMAQPFQPADPRRSHEAGNREDLCI